MENRRGCQWLESMCQKVWCYGSDGQRKRWKAREVVSYSGKLEARVNFYVEAVSGYDDTTDCSVR